MALELTDFERKARDSVKAFWGNRGAALQKQRESGKSDQVKDLDIVAMGAIAGVCGWIIGMLTSGYSNRAETGQSESQFTYVRGVGIYTVTHDGHRWVVSNQGGIVHHPDCQCNRFKQRTQKLKLV